MPRTSKGAWRNTESEILQTIKSLRHATAARIAEILNLHVKTILCKIRYLRTNNRVYISGYKKQFAQGPYKHVYSIKLYPQEQDAVKPDPVTGSQKTANYRARLKQREILYGRKLTRIGIRKKE